MFAIPTEPDASFIRRLRVRVSMWYMLAVGFVVNGVLIPFGFFVRGAPIMAAPGAGLETADVHKLRDVSRANEKRRRKAAKFTSEIERLAR